MLVWCFESCTSSFIMFYLAFRFFAALVAQPAQFTPDADRNRKVVRSRNRPDRCVQRELMAFL